MSISIEIQERIRKYCAYQERCQQETRTKLFSLGVRGDEAESLIASLISENYINEERYARAFARGKFRINKWGKRKIELALRRKGISIYCIKKGLSEINQQEYLSAMKDLIGKPFPLKTAEKLKALRVLISKGFEPALVKTLLKIDLDIHSDQE